METGTLKELNVKPGDVVAYLGGEEYLVCDGNKLQWPDGTVQEYRYWDSGQFSIVSRSPTPDLTTINTPFGLLDEATQEALRAHGGPYEYFYQGEWIEGCNVGNLDCWAWRVQPQPVIENAQVDIYCRGHKASAFIQLKDGEPDWSTLKVEPR